MGLVQYADQPTTLFQFLGFETPLRETPFDVVDSPHSASQVGPKVSASEQVERADFCDPRRAASVDHARVSTGDQSLAAQRDT